MQDGDQLTTNPQTAEPEVLGSDSVAPAPKKKRSGKLWLWIAGATLILLGLIALVTFGLKQKSNRSTETSNDTVKPQKIDTSSLSPTVASFTVNEDRIIINGQLQATDTLVLSPSAQPTVGVTGQIYFDQTTNNLRYYNGQAFVDLASSNELAALQGSISAGSAGAGGQVTSLQGATGALTLLGSSGLTITAAGTNITINLPQNLTTTANPTFSNLNLTGVTANQILYSNGSSLQSITPPGTGLCLISQAVGAPIFDSCVSGGFSVASIVGTAGGSDILTGALTINNASTDDVTDSITINTASDTLAGLVSTAAQTFAGVKTFTDDIIFQGAGRLSADAGVGILTVPIEEGKLCTSDLTTTSDDVLDLADYDICYNKFASASGSGQYIQFAPDAAQVDSSSDPLVSTIFVQKTGIAGDIIRIQGTGDAGTEDAFRLYANGDTYFKSLNESNNAFRLLGFDGTAALTLSTKSPSSVLQCTIDFEGGPCAVNVPSSFIGWDEGSPVTPTSVASSAINHTVPGSTSAQITNGSVAGRHGVYLPVDIPYFTDDNNQLGPATYTMSFYFFRNTPGLPILNAGFYRDTGNPGEATPPYAEINDFGSNSGWGQACNAKRTKNNTWIRYQCTFTMTDNEFLNRDADGIWIYAKGNFTESDLGVWYIDDVIFTQGTTTASYSNLLTLEAPLIVQPTPYDTALMVTDGAGSSIFNVNSNTQSVVISAVRGDDGPEGATATSAALEVSNDNGPVALFVSSDNTNGSDTVLIQGISGSSRDLLSFRSATNQEMTSFTSNGYLMFRDVPGGTTGTLRVAAALTGGNKTYTLPDFVGSAADICLNTGNCNAGPGGATLQSGYTASTGGSTPEIKLDSTRGALDIQDADTPLAGSLLRVWGSGVDITTGDPLFDINSDGQVTLQNGLDSDSAFRVQDSTGLNTIFGVDTATDSGYVNIGNLDNNFFAQLDSSALGSTQQFSFPSTGGIICVVEASNCGGDGLGSTGTEGYIALFGSGGTTVDDSILQQTDGTTLSAAGNLILVGDSGTAGITLGSASTNNGQIVFRNSTNANTLTLQSGITAGGSLVFTLPTGTGSNGECLKTNGDSPTTVLSFGSCGGAGSGTTLQNAYDDGNTILTTDNRNIAFTLGDTPTDSDFIVNMAGTGNTIELQDSGTAFATFSDGGHALFKPTSNHINAFQIQPFGSGVNVFNVDTSNSRIGINNNAPTYTLDVNGTAIAGTAGSVVRFAGTLSDVANLQSGVFIQPTIAPSGAAGSNSYLGLFVNPLTSSTNMASASFRGIWSSPAFQGSGALGTLNGIITNIQNTGGGTVTTGIGIQIVNPTNSGGGTITTNYGMFINAQSAGTNDFGIVAQKADTSTIWLQSADGTPGSGLSFGGNAFTFTPEVYLYRSAVNTLRISNSGGTAGTLVVNDLSISSAAITAPAALSITTGAAFGVNSTGGISLISSAGSFGASANTSASLAANTTISIQSGTALTVTSGTTLTLKSINAGAATSAVTLESGNSSNNVSGTLTLQSGTADTTSGVVLLSSGNSNQSSGAVNIQSGTGVASGYTSGAINLTTGTYSSSGSNAFTSGAISLRTGTSISSTTGLSGRIELSTGNIVGVSGTYSGDVDIITGEGTVAGGSGNVNINVGDGIGGTSNTGSINIGTRNTANVVSLQNQVGTASSINVGAIGSSTFASNIHIADTSSGTGTQSVTIGSTANTANTLTLQGGTITALASATTGNGVSLTASSLTTGSGLVVNTTNTNTTNASVSGVRYNLTNAQGSTAVTGSNLISGFDIQFTQAATVAGSLETAGRFAIAASSSSPTDTDVTSILQLANLDTATGNQITAINGLQIEGANVTNGILFNGTFGTNLITSSTGNFIVSYGGALTVTAATINGTLTVNGDSIFNGNITVDGHIISSGDTPTIDWGGAGACTGPSGLTITGTDVAGTISFVSGTGCTTPTGSMVEITFDTPYAAAPKGVIITANNDKASALDYYVDGTNTTTTEFTIDTSTVLTDSTTYTFNYIVIQ